MIDERQKVEFWNYLTAEKNQPRPKGITVQRLAVVKPIVIASDLWTGVNSNIGAFDGTGVLPIRGSSCSAIENAFLEVSMRCYFAERK